MIDFDGFLRWGADAEKLTSVAGFGVNVEGMPPGKSGAVSGTSGQ